MLPSSTRTRLRTLALGSVGVCLLAFGGCDTEPAPKAQPAAYPPYTYGTDLRFGEGGSETPYLKAGWSVPEKGFRWTSSGQAGLALGVPAPPGDVLLRTTFAMALTGSPGPAAQRVVVSGNGRKISEWVVKQAGVQEATIPRDVLAGGTLDLWFELPDALEPSRLSGSADGRKLAVAVQSLSLSPR
jgi:hypothetical protein